MKLKYWSGESITKLEHNYVFVFGSNPEGRHGMGAAKDAMKFGAKYGIGRGLQGQTYALVTKNLKKGYVEKSTGITYTSCGKCSVSLDRIKSNIQELYHCCNNNKDKKFFVAYKNDHSNLNGYSSNQVFNCFTEVGDIPDNIYFHNSFKESCVE